MQPHLARQPLHRRLLGAVAALAVTAMLLSGLELAPLPEPLLRALPVASVTVFLQPQRVELPTERPVQAPTRTDPRRLTRPAEPPAYQRLTARPQRLQSPVTPTAAEPAQLVTVPDPVTVPAPTASAPRPLRIDGQVLRSAASASRGGVMAMVDAAGRGTEDRNNSRPSWTRAVGSAARADCLQADENASLLSAVLIVARAVTDRCP